MNKVFSFCFLAAGLCFAQNPSNAAPVVPVGQAQAAPVAAPAPAAPAPEPVVEEAPPPQPAPAVQAAADPSKAFDMLRGHAYNPFAIEGASSNVWDIVATPADIYGQKFIYVSPMSSARLGYAAFDLGGGSMLLGLDNSEDIGALILGFATDAFGVSLDYSISKMWTSYKPGGNSVSQRSTRPNDNIGLNFSLPVGFYVNLGWRTYDDSYALETDDLDATVDYSTINVKLGLLGNSGSLNYNVYLDVVRTGGSATNSVTADKKKGVDENTYSGATLGFNLGYAAFQSQTARLIVGSNNYFSMEFYDEVKNILESGSIITLQIQPTILGEVILADRWLAFIGAKQDINLKAGEGGSFRNEDNSQLEIEQDQTETLFAGMRYQKENWALEAIVSDNPFAALGGSNILFSLGGFIYF
jgi:hypothetical protein